MEGTEYLEAIKEKYRKYFDIENNINILNQKIDFFAKCRITNNRTLITKNDIVDSYENNEYCFIKKYDSISLKDVIEYSEFLKAANSEYVKPQGNHMSSYVTGVMISEEAISEEVQEYAKKFRYSKAYSFYLKGWSEVRLILTDLSRQLVVTNKSGKSVKKVYQIAP